MENCGEEISICEKAKLRKREALAMASKRKEQLCKREKAEGNRIALAA